MQIQFLGTSSGEAIPRDGCDCPQCLSIDKKDKRLRSALLINKKLLIDAGPDIQNQLTNSQIKALEIVLTTHDHTDHIGGIKDLLKIKPNLKIVKLQPGQHFKLNEIEFYAFKVKHSNIITTVGLEVGTIAYIPDFADLDWAMKYLRESKVAILDGSVLGKNFAGHKSINETIAQVKGLRNLRKIYFTHNGHTHKPHKEMVKLVKAYGDDRFGLAYDGLTLKI